MATIRDVAKMAGVSISTVSLALNGTGPVAEETYQKVLEAAQSVGYAPNPLAQGLKMGRSRLIGMVMADISNPFFGQLLSEVERMALGHNHLVIASDTGGKPEREKAILEHLGNQRVAGILISTLSHHPQQVQALKRLTMPFVLVDQKVEGIEADFVASDNVLASAILTEHLIRYGHTRIAHIAGRKGLWTTGQRLEGFRTTMVSAGLAIDETMVVDGDYTGEGAYAQTMRLLTRADRPTAIIGANNVMALGALQAMHDLGFRCPEDVSLVSIDDVPWGNVIRPRITMVVQPVEEMARIATEFLLERINSRSGTPILPRQHILIPKLVVGQSCAAPQR